MSWSLTLGDRIGIELPFLEPPELMVSLEVNVDFPDTDPMGIYVFPSLYYEVYGPGIDSSPRLISQNSADGGIISIDIGATKMRIYLRYDARPGPLGTLPHGDIRRSFLTMKAAPGFSVPSLGTRVHELILDVGATRITMVEGTTLGVPYIGGYTTPEPMVAVESFVYTAFNANYWAKFVLTEPPVTDLALRITPYVTYTSVQPPLTQTQSSQAATIAGTYNFLHITAGGTNGSTYVQNEAGVVTLATALGGVRVIPAGTKAIFHKGVTAIGSYNTFMANKATTGDGHFYYRYHLEAVNTPQANRGKNWRIPVYTFMDSFFTGRNVTEAPWYAEITDYGL